MSLRLASRAWRSVRMAQAGRIVGVPQLQWYSAKADVPPGREGQQRQQPADDDLRRRVLEASLLEVPKLGWTLDALTAGAAACDLSPMAHGLVPRGPIELVEYFSTACNEQLAAELVERAEELEALEVHNRLLVAMQTRLRMVAPHISTWPQALALRALPSNLSNTLYDGHELASQLLDACGEDAKAPLMPPPIDPLIKIMSIGAIYGAAELHLLTDRSADLNDTWIFLEKEVETLKTMANAKGRLPDLSLAGVMLSFMGARK